MALVTRVTRTRMRRFLVGAAAAFVIYSILLNLANLAPSYTGYESKTSEASSVLTREVDTGQTADHAEDEDPPAATDVLLSSYMRSGSSFLGQVLGFRHDAFYVYEPLWTLAKFSYFRGPRERCDIFKQGCDKSGHLSVALKVLHQIYNCTFYMKPAAGKFRDNINVKLSGPKWHSYTNCQEKQSPNSTCLRQLANRKCDKSRHVVTKVLRLAVQNTELLLQARPNLKVVYLVRDPRAIINSHMRTGWSYIRRDEDGGGESVAAAAVAICKRIEEDVKDAINLKAAYPDRFIIIQYEDFADPLPKVKALYSFLNMSFASEVMRFIDKTHKPRYEHAQKKVSGSELDLGDMREVLDKLNPGDAKEFIQRVNKEGDAGIGADTLSGRSYSNELEAIETGKDNGDIDDTLLDDYEDDISDENIDENNNINEDNNYVLEHIGRALKSVQSKKDDGESNSRDGNHPFMYRESLSWQQVQEIDSQCHKVYRLLGYRKYNSERDLKTLKIPAVKGPLTFALETSSED